MTTLETITLSIAIWGAVLSSIAFIWNLRRNVIHQGKLRVHCYRGKIVGGDFTDEQIYLIYNVTNIGKEPVMLTHFGGTTTDKEFGAFCITPENGNAPKMLQPGEYVIQKAGTDVLDETLLTLNASDSLRRNFNCPKKAVKELVKQQKEANQREEPMLKKPVGSINPVSNVAHP